MELEARLRALAAFARQQSFSAAAAELFISQPAVSKHIADLERHVGIQLVIRHPRGGTLTPAGEFLAQYILRAEALLAQASRGLGAFSNPGHVSLLLAASGTPGTYLLPRILGAFHESYPGVEINTFFGNSEQVVEAVRSHKAEIGLVGGLAAAPEIQVEALVEDEVVLIGPTALAGRQFEPSALQAYTWVSREEGSATRSMAETAWQDLGVTSRARLEMPSWEAVKLVVASGVGIAACSRLALEVELKAGTLVVLDVPRWNVHRTISIISMADVPLTPPAAQFLVLLRQYEEGSSLRPESLQ